MDTKPLETEALDFIKSKVACYGYRIAVLNFDEDGCDFLIIRKTENYKCKCLRCQSKGRSIFPNTSSVVIPKPYVRDDFLVFVYLKPEDVDAVVVYLFLADDIKSYWEDKGDHYYLYLSKDFMGKERNDEFLFKKDRASVIESLLADVGRVSNSDSVNALLDLEFYYKMWQKTGGLPSLEYLRELDNGDIFEIIGTKRFVFLICALIIQNCDSDISLSVDWAYFPLKTKNVCERGAKGYVEGRTYYSEVAITYRSTWVKELISESGELAGYHLHIGDNEEYVNTYVWRLI